MSNLKAKPQQRPTVHFSYLDPKGFSGQRAATELVINGLSRRGWSCWRLPQPVLDRSDNARFARAAYFIGMLRAWLRGGRLLISQGDWLCINLPQTRAGMLRDAINLCLARLGVGRNRIVISLHGSLFMHWNERSFEARLFCRLLAQAGTVTVLGNRQRERLLQLGVKKECVHVVVNSCDLPLLSSSSVKQKHGIRVRAVVKVLYLSSLIDTKGFPEYLEALHILSGSDGPQVEAVLCGQLFNAEQCERFANSAAAEVWIEKMLADINRSRHVRVRWVKGAMGAAKIALFQEADIFVLPTRYAVEAQPLVLLEAMASGCAIVTTDIGEITTVLDRQCAVLLRESTGAEVANALRPLLENSDACAQLALAAYARFTDRYAVDRHLDAWEQLLGRAARKGVV